MPRRPAATPRPPVADPAAALGGWFAGRGWSPFDFQCEAWGAYRGGRSGLVHSATGTGKTLAVWGGPLLEFLAESPDPSAWRPKEPPALRVLWVTPLRALAADTLAALREPIAGLGLPWSLEGRTGDTSSAARARQRKRLPTALVTTPESLSLLLSRDDAAATFADLRCVVVDEWHELLASKRGVQVELALARLRRWRPGLRTWGLSATLGNLEEAAAVLWGVAEDLSPQPPPRSGEGEKDKRPPVGRVPSECLDPPPGGSLTCSPSPLRGGGRGERSSGLLLRGRLPKAVVIDAILPDDVERFPWAGHLGLRLVPAVADAVAGGRTALVFTNTRAQAETWYQALLEHRPEWAGRIALHHGSLDRKTRDFVEAGLKDGSLRCVVCTSSLDLGVDFSPVDRVLQVGSPKGVARLLQRAGRSGHQPGSPSRVTVVPTNVLELVEVAAAREAASAGRIESRPPLERPLDVLAQHLVTVALGGGFTPDDLLAEARTTHAYRGLTDDEWAWCLDFVARGGETLRAYPEFQRVRPGEDGVWRVADERVARRHRMAVGTIVGEASVEVRFLRGGRLGTVEESFVARLRPGDRFVFAGRPLEFVRVRDLTAWVRLSKKAGAVPRWQGSRLPLSGELAAGVRDQLARAGRGEFDSPELRAVRPVLAVQARWSRLPAADELLVERTRTREGHHLFFFPFEGRSVHEGLSAVLALRLSRRRPLTFTLAVNDYGFELLSPDPAPLDEALADGLLSPDGLADDVPAGLNAAELARRHFREVARVAGLVHPGMPGAGKTAKQLQASSGLFYDVFAEHDPDNLLLLQARREVLERQLERPRLEAVLRRVAAGRVTLVTTARPTPLAFPLLVERLRAEVSSESLADRVRRMQVVLERAAGG